MNRINKLIVKSSFSSSFTYLKAVLQLVIKHIAKDSNIPTKVAVKKDHNGIPTIIPKFLRDEIVMTSESNAKVVIAILTILSIFRTFHVNIKPSFKTIAAPFTGVTKILNNDLLTSVISGLIQSSGTT